MKQSREKSLRIISYFFTLFWIFFPYIRESRVREELSFQFTTLWEYLNGLFTYSNIIQTMMDTPTYIGYMLLLVVNIGYIIYSLKKHPT